MPKTIAELKQELQDAGRDVRMAGEMVERASGGSQDIDALCDAMQAMLDGLLVLNRVADALGQSRRLEAAK